ncbi:spore germination protein GerPC [Paenibacillus arenilitoris]|uniref:Uncharacterized protein n=1 Tax=Paenibacillus arenilitoris TaxID=2772299 RepID=A0A927H6H9_9BACL|nr:spore germination protein GerPC [Paenibacillus arenilitoris]MBD2869522.1 hypothetical protein [Paenibacillus arenilitoris]
MQQMNQLSPWQIWSLEVQNALKAQQERIDGLESQLAELCEKIKQLEAKPTYNIESIEYHFDQLKVEKLDGTLNIGMTAPGDGDESFPGTVDQLAVAKPEVFPAAGPAIPPPTGPYADIYAGMNRYLDTEALQKLQSFESELCLPLDPYHRRIIIEDVRKQLPPRIEYYLQAASKGNNGQNGAGNNGDVTGQVLAKTKRDADAAMLAYMKQLQSGSAPAGGMA